MKRGSVAVCEPKCVPGCDGKSAISCVANAPVITSCAASNRECKDGQCVDCLEGAADICNEDFSASLSCVNNTWQSTPCSQDTRCARGVCTTRKACDAGYIACADLKTQIVCGADLLEESKLCGDGLLCYEGECSAPRAGDCDPKTFSRACINDKEVSTCGADYHQKVLHCATRTCQGAGECVEVCTEGAQPRCTLTGALEQCVDGAWRETSCDTGKLCLGSACKEAQCLPATHKPSCDAAGNYVHCDVSGTLKTETCEKATGLVGAKCKTMGEGFGACIQEQGCSSETSICQGNVLKSCQSGREYQIDCAAQGKVCGLYYNDMDMETGEGLNQRALCVNNTSDAQLCVDLGNGRASFLNLINSSYFNTNVARFCASDTEIKECSIVAGVATMSTETCSGKQVCNPDAVVGTETVPQCQESCSSYSYVETCNADGSRNVCKAGRVQQEPCSTSSTCVQYKDGTKTKTACNIADLCKAEGDYVCLGEKLAQCQTKTQTDSGQSIVLPSKIIEEGVACSAQKQRLSCVLEGASYVLKAQDCAAGTECLSVNVGTSFAPKMAVGCLSTCTAQDKTDATKRCAAEKIEACEKVAGQTQYVWTTVKINKTQICEAGISMTCQGRPDASEPQTLCAQGELCLQSDSGKCVPECAQGSALRCKAQEPQECVLDRDSDKYYYKSNAELNNTCVGSAMISCAGVADAQSPKNLCVASQSCYQVTNQTAACSDVCTTPNTYKCRGGKIQQCQTVSPGSSVWVNRISSGMCNPDETSNSLFSCEGVADNAEPKSIPCGSEKTCLKNESSCMAHCSAAEVGTSTCSADQHARLNCYKVFGKDLYLLRVQTVPAGYLCVQTAPGAVELKKPCTGSGPAGCSIITDESTLENPTPKAYVDICYNGYITQSLAQYCDEGQVSICQLAADSQSATLITMPCTAADNAHCATDKSFCIYPDCGSITAQGSCNNNALAKCMDGSNGSIGLLYADCASLNEGAKHYQCAQIPGVGATCTELCSDNITGLGMCDGNALKICKNGAIVSQTCANGCVELYDKSLAMCR